MLAYFLKPGGVLLVVDLLKSEEYGDAERESLFPEHAAHIVAHPLGFSESDMREAFVSTGLVSFGFGEAMAVKKSGQDVKLFIATGTKPVR